MNSGKSTSLDSVDRISDLPDSILCHILSFLPTKKDVVATDILSKRWSFVWTRISNLDFHYPDQSLESSKFVDFVNHVLLLHKPVYLNRLSLTFETKSIPSDVQAWINSWICAAVARDVRELFVSFMNTVFRLPIRTQKILFSCEGLQSLELKSNICITSEIAVCLPRLERLRLSSLDFENEEAFSKLLDGCPVLKYLFIHMDRVNMTKLKCLISSTSLRHLELYTHYQSPINEVRYACSIQLDAPLLEYIKLQAPISRIFIQQQSLTSLVEANIQLEIIALNSSSVVEAFRAFDCAKALILSANVFRALSWATISMKTTFKRLTRLEVTIDWNHWSLLQDFISLSNNLAVLTIKKGYGKRGHYLNNSNWKKPNTVPRCLSNSLKRVSIDAYYGYPDQLAMVSYILKHGSVLQVMQICFDKSVSDFKKKFELVQTISKFPRNSHVCEVEFC